MRRLPERIELIEVGPRDGLQMETTFVPTELKVALVDDLARAGLRRIETTSFVHPDVIPQTRDAEAVLAAIERPAAVRFTALVPNLRGAERALAAGVDGLHLVIATTEQYNQRNVGMSRDASFEQLRRIVKRLEQERGDVRVDLTVTLAVAFGCPFEGEPGRSELVELVERLADRGVDCVGLADTAGIAHPLLISDRIGAVRERLPELGLRLHLHDTRGLALANAIVAMQCGVTAFDTAFGGLGGCPIMQGASGNLATEDLVHCCAEMGISTGVDLDSVRQVSRRFEAFAQRKLASRVLQAGTRAELYARNRGSPA